MEFQNNASNKEGNVCHYQEYIAKFYSSERADVYHKEIWELNVAPRRKTFASILWHTGRVHVFPFATFSICLPTEGFL